MADANRVGGIDRAVLKKGEEGLSLNKGCPQFKENKRTL